MNNFKKIEWNRSNFGVRSSRPDQKDPQDRHGYFCKIWGWKTWKIPGKIKVFSGIFPNFPVDLAQIPLNPRTNGWAPYEAFRENRHPRSGQIRGANPPTGRTAKTCQLTFSYGVRGKDRKKAKKEKLQAEQRGGDWSMAFNMAGFNPNCLNVVRNVHLGAGSLASD